MLMKLKNFQTQKDKKLALKVQLNFRQKALGVRCNQSLFAITSGAGGGGGVGAKNLPKVIENLK